MSFKRRSWGAAQGQEPVAQAPREPTFIVKESTKTGVPFVSVNSRVNDRGAMVMLYPSKFAGQFVALGVNGWRGGMIPVKEDNIDVVENPDGSGVLKLDLGWLKIEVLAKNVKELIEFLQAAQTMPKQAPQMGGGAPAAPAAPAPAAPAPVRAGWKR